MSSSLTSEPVKPLLRGVSHEVGFFVALLAGALLIIVAPGTTAKLACAVYATSLAALLGISALYHRPTWNDRARARMRRLDHSAIFVLIAGTYTPVSLTLPSAEARTLLITIWAAGLLGVLRALFWVHAPKWIVAALALAMGWLGVFYFSAVKLAIGTGPLWWIGLGGVFYSAGALAYAFRRPNPWPRVFGYHEIFHAFVLLAACCHFVAIVAVLPLIHAD